MLYLIIREWDICEDNIEILGYETDYKEAYETVLKLNENIPKGYIKDFSYDIKVIEKFNKEKL